jgi:hypothetical protein
MDNQLFYLIQPEALDFPSDGMSLQERRDRLRQLLEEHGALWVTIRSPGTDFMESVEELDRFLGADNELTDCVFENSPGEILPIGSCDEYDPLFGYYERERVVKFHGKLSTIPSHILEEWENRPEPQGEILSAVVHAFRSSFAEAASRKWAIAIDHG